MSQSTTVVVTEAGPACKRVSISVPAKDVDAAIEQAMSEAAASVSLPGFRPGRVPRSMIEKRFGKALLEEARSKLVDRSFGEAAESKGLKPLTQPRLPEGATLPDLKRGAAFEFAVELEVLPEFTLPAWEGLAIKKPVIDVADEHINAELERMSYRFGTPERITGPFVRLDRMVGHATVRAEGIAEPILDSDGVLAVVPAEQDGTAGPMLGLMIEGLDTALIGKSVGDAVVIQTTGPEAHEREEIRGKKLTIDYRIADAERITPASTEQLATGFGAATAELLRDQVRLGLEQRRDGEQAAALREQVVEILTDAVQMELPERLSSAQAQRDLARREYELLHRGMDPQRVEREIAAARAESGAQSRRRLKTSFILAKLADELGVDVTDAEVNGRIASIARQQNTRPEKLRAELQKSGAIMEIASSIREGKTAERVVAKATITEVPAIEWNKAIEERTAARRVAKSSTK